MNHRVVPHQIAGTTRPCIGASAIATTVSVVCLRTIEGVSLCIYLHMRFIACFSRMCVFLPSRLDGLDSHSGCSRLHTSGAIIPMSSLTPTLPPRCRLLCVSTWEVGQFAYEYHCAFFFFVWCCVFNHSLLRDGNFACQFCCSLVCAGGFRFQASFSFGRVKIWAQAGRLW